MTRALALVALWILPLPAEEIRFDSARDWNTWNLPAGIVEPTPDGRLQPVAIRRGIDATANLAAFGGGIHHRSAATLTSPM